MRATPLALILATLHAPAVARQNTAALKKWPTSEGGNDHTYEIYTQPSPLSWSVAERLALSRGGHLATLTTRAENDFVLALAAAVDAAWTSRSGDQGIGPWIGAIKDKGSRGSTDGWHWVTDEPFADQFWAPKNAPESGDDLRMLLFPTGWDDVRQDFGEARACVIEYGPGGKRPNYKPPTLVQWKKSDGGNNHYYRLVLHPGGLTWPEADEMARRSGGYLATLTSKQENDFVLTFAKGTERAWTDWSGAPLGPWIGGYTDDRGAEKDGDWRWVTGEPFTKGYWAPGNDPGRGKNKHILLFPTGWNDVDTTMRSVVSFVIEYGRPPGQILSMEPTDKPTHPAAKAVQACFELLKKGNAKAAVARYWHPEGLLRRAFGEAFDRLPPAPRQRMRQQMAAHLECRFGSPEAIEAAGHVKLSAFLLTSDTPDGNLLRVEFLLRDDRAPQAEPNWFIMERVGSVWRIVDIGSERSPSLAGGLGADRDLLGLTPEQFMKELDPARR